MVGGRNSRSRWLLVAFLLASLAAADAINECVLDANATGPDQCLTDLATQLGAEDTRGALNACDEIADPTARDACTIGVIGHMATKNPKTALLTCHAIMVDEAPLASCCATVKPNFNIFGMAAYYYYTRPRLVFTILLLFPLLMFIAGGALFAMALREEAQAAKPKEEPEPAADENMDQFVRAEDISETDRRALPTGDEQYQKWEAPVEGMRIEQMDFGGLDRRALPTGEQQQQQWQAPVGEWQQADQGGQSQEAGFTMDTIERDGAQQKEKTGDEAEEFYS